MNLIRVVAWRGLVSRASCAFGSYYRTVRMFQEVENTAANTQKIDKIREYKNQLLDGQRQQFQQLIDWYQRKEPIRISSKVILKYYLTQYIDAAQHAALEQKLKQGTIIQLLSKQNQESQLTIHDINIFIKYLCSLQGTGTQKEKAKRVIELGQKVSVLEGMFLFKIIERRLTIGASQKTFRKADQGKSIPPKKKAEKKDQRQKGSKQTIVQTLQTESIQK